MQDDEILTIFLRREKNYLKLSKYLILLSRFLLFGYLKVKEECKLLEQFWRGVVDKQKKILWLSGPGLCLVKGAISNEIETLLFDDMVKGSCATHGGF